MWIAWLKQNKLSAVIFVILCLFVLSGAAGSYHYRQLLKTAQSNLEEERKYLSEREAVNEEATGKKDAEIGRKIEPVLRDIAGLRADVTKLREKQEVSPTPPASDDDRIARWLGLGVKVRIVAVP
jgi:hypothetical protein